MERTFKVEMTSKQASRLLTACQLAIAALNKGLEIEDYDFRVELVDYYAELASRLNHVCDEDSDSSIANEEK